MKLDQIIARDAITRENFYRRNLWMIINFLFLAKLYKFLVATITGANKRVEHQECSIILWEIYVNNVLITNMGLYMIVDLLCYTYSKDLAKNLLGNDHLMLKKMVHWLDSDIIYKDKML